MRISTAYSFSSLNNDITSADTNMVNLQNELSTGKSINQVSDNPYLATLAINQTEMNSQLSQYNSNLGYATTFLDFSEQGFSNASTLTNSAVTLAQQAANSTVSQSARDEMVSQITQLQNQLVSIANTQGANGEYIYGGQVTQTAPFTVTGNTLTYNGDQNAISVQTGPNATMQINTPGSPVFTDLYNNLEQLKTDMTSGNLTAISGTDLANLQNSSSTILQLEAQAGANIQTVNAQTSANTRRTQELTSDITTETSANYASTITQYTEAQSVYQAALSVAGNAMKLSLTDYLQA